MSYQLDYTGSKINKLLQYVENQMSTPDFVRTKPTIEWLEHDTENHYFELKSTLEICTEKKQKDKGVKESCLKTIAGFLNANGGVLLIGITDDKKVIGIEEEFKILKVENDDKFELRLRDYIRNNFTPFPKVKIDIEFEDVQHKKICRVNIPRGHEPVYYNKKFYLRSGNQTVYLKEEVE